MKTNSGKATLSNDKIANIRVKKTVILMANYKIKNLGSYSPLTKPHLFTILIEFYKNFLCCANIKKFVADRPDLIEQEIELT